MATKTDKKPQRTRAEISAIRRAAGKKGGHAKAGHISPARLEKQIIKEHVDQRFMRATDAMINAQVSLGIGQQFLYRIDKEWIPSGGKNGGYFRNKPPVLVTSQYEIEMYLSELAENNGELNTDEQDEGSSYYYITTKEPNNQALDSMLNRVHGKPRDDSSLGDIAKAFSLLAIAARARELRLVDGNKDIVKNALPEASEPYQEPSSDK